MIFISSVRHECIFDKKLISGGGAFPPCGSRAALNKPPPPPALAATGDESPHTCAPPHAQNPQKGSLRGATVVAVGGWGGGQGWGFQMHIRRQGTLSQRRRRGRAAPRASVTNQRLSGVDSAPWMSVIPQRPYAEQQHAYYGMHRRAND